LLGWDSAPRLERFELSKQWLAMRGMGPDPNKLFMVTYPFRLVRAERLVLFASFFAEHALPPDMDGLLCMDDSLALYFLHAMRLNKQSPNRLALMGVNNYPICEEVFPSLTSIEIPFLADGARLMEMIVAVIHGDSTPVNAKSHLRVVVRDSA